jgi:imidazole glycerol-phosphate synthase subunit HisH
MTTIIDYGIGNLRSVEKALEMVGADVIRTDDPAAIARAERLVLPGVGAFGACAAEIRRRGLEQPILDAVERGIPLLGVCVGMQLLFDLSEEMGEHRGLGLLQGRVIRFEAPLEGPPLKVPHMGWNPVEIVRDTPLTGGLDGAPHYYFVHSYHAAPENESDILGLTDYGVRFASMVHRDNVYGVQFHPEKSQAAGLAILRNFSQLGRVTTATAQNLLKQ